MQVFADTVGRYYAAGWRGILPVPTTAKWPPPGGRPGELSYTGDSGIDTDLVTLARWAAGRYGGYSIALRMPEGVIGIDIDHYIKGDKVKTGDDDLRTLVEQLGELPPTWASTARGTGEGPGPSRTLFYRVPPGRYRANLSPSIEVLQRHHRYAVVAPSVHSEVGTRYQWYEPAGFGWVETATGLPEVLPSPGELPELPAAWVAHLAEGASSVSPAAADPSSGAALLAELLADVRDACADVVSARDVALAELAGVSAGGRHDTATGRVYQLVQLGAVGHPGVGAALGDLGLCWEAATPGEDRGNEWARILLTAARKAVTALAEMGAKAQVRSDPCAMMGPGMARLAELYAQQLSNGPPQQGTTPQLTGAQQTTTQDQRSRDSGAVSTSADLAQDGADGPPVDDPSTTPDTPAAQWSLWEHLGVHAFDPPGGHDQTLAEDVLLRVWPVLRYASDAGTWVLRGPQTWELAGDLAGWAVAVLAGLMPRGNIEASEGSPERQRAERRKRLRTTSSANAVAAKMRALVAAGTHPASVKLAELDADPEVLWAGGIAWDLRGSVEAPAQAAIHPGTPHLHATPLLPCIRPTPLWDEFLAAVWPDPEIRAWALQCLAVGLTGYSDAVVPILWGVTGSGKTSVVELIMSTLGTYADPVSSKLLAAMDNSHASIIMALKGLRWATVDEGPRAGAVAAEQFKALTGGGRLTGNRMRENPVTFTPTHTLVMTTNPEPNVTDPAVRRRIRLIPCNGDAFEVAQTRARLVNGAWRAEAPGVLAQMMALAGRFLLDRRTVAATSAPLAVRFLADDLAQAQNVISMWIEAQMVPDEHGTKASELLHDYTAWSRVLRAPVLTATRFGAELTELGYPPVHRKDGKYRGLKHRDDAGFGTSGLPVPPPAVKAPPAGPKGVSTPSNAADAETNSPPLPKDHRTGAPWGAPETANAEVGGTGLAGGDGIGDGLEYPSPGKDLAVTQVTPNTGIGPERVTGDDGISEPVTQPVTGSDQLLLLFGDGLTGQTGYNISTSIPHDQNKQNHDQNTYDQENEKHLSNGGNNPSHPSPRHPVTADTANTSTAPGDIAATLRAAARAGGTTLPDAHLTPASEPAPPPAKPKPAKRGKLTQSEKAERAAARKEETRLRQEAARLAKALAKDAAKAAQIAEAAGPLIELPHVALRGGQPRTAQLAEAAELVHRAIARSGALTVDSEGNGYPLGHRHYALRTVQLGDTFEGATFDAADPWHMLVVKDLLAAAPIFHAHNAPADLVPLAAAEVIDWRGAWDRMYDTILPAKLNDPTSTGNEEGLKRLGPAVLGAGACSPAAAAARGELWKAAGWTTDVKLDTPIETNGWAQVDSRCTTMARYALCDVFDTAPLYGRLPQVPPALLARERELQRLCARVTLEGLALDGEHVHRMLDEHTVAREPLRARLAQLGIENPGSPKQVADRLTAAGMVLPTTAAGNASVAEGVLEGLRHEGWGEEITEVVETVLAWRHHNTAITMFCRPFSLLVEHGDGRVRPTIYTLGADTGRMSCVRENLQKLSREGGIRAMIVADPGMMQIGADLAGIELRMAAALSGDENLKQIILESDARPDDRIDIHWRIARQVFGPDATKANRYTIKPGVFGKIYGGSIAVLAAQMGCSQAIAKAMSNTLDAMAPRLAQWSKQVMRAVQKGHTTFETYSGRVIHLDKRLPHKAPNWLIQGTSREVIVDGILRWSQTPWGERVLLPVHDEVNSWVPAAEAEAATAAMLESLNCEVLGMPVRAEAAAPSPYWADAA